MRVSIYDYGAGNIHSIAKALARVGGDVRVETDVRRAVAAELFVLPGVGAFAPAAARLAPDREFVRAAIRDGLPTLGICLGMQLLLDSSDEGAGDGLGIIPGRVTRLSAQRVPQIGWNTVDESSDAAGRQSGLTTPYYANGFACRPTDLSVVTAWSTHEGDRFPAIVRRGSVVGVQFHPEKSSTAGIAFLSVILSEAQAMVAGKAGPSAATRDDDGVFQ
jgi:imidazole glycerol-phosphate synthase subunit HisH